MGFKIGNAASGAASGAAIGSVFPGPGTAIGAVAGGLLGGFGSGKKEKNYQQSLLTPQQQQLQAQGVNAAMRPGAGGAFGESADYYRNNLSNNPQDFEDFENPELRRFNEQIVPGLAEQFAGLGAGQLSSSGFTNAAVGAGADLSERLGALRAQLRQNSAAGLQSIGQAGLGQTGENVLRPQTQGFADQLLPLAGQVVTARYGAKK